MTLFAPGVNFINILHARFFVRKQISKLLSNYVWLFLFLSFSLITVGVVIFGAKILHKKFALKTLMKLTVGGYVVF